MRGRLPNYPGMKKPRRPRLLLAMTAAATLSALAPAGAQAGLLVSSATSCESQDVSQPFLPWADVANYVLAPGGELESAPAGWRLGAASVVDGNEPWKVRDARDSHALAIPAGDSVTTASMCVGIEHPTLRFFARGGGGLDTLRVEVLFEDALGQVHSTTIGAVTPTQWAPTAPFPVVANLLPLLPGEHTAVAFRFTSVGTGAWTVDDVYDDPYARY